MYPQYKTPVSVFLLMIPSCIVAFVGIVMYSLADIRNTYDILIPLTVVIQFIFAVMILSGKRIGYVGLIGISLILLGACVATLTYYVQRNQIISAGLPTLAVLAIISLPVLDLWVRHRAYFRR